MRKLLNEILGIEHPIIVAPMFLVSNVEMVVDRCEALTVFRCVLQPRPNEDDLERF